MWKLQSLFKIHQLVIWVDFLLGILDGCVLVEEDLSVSDIPITKDHHEEWRLLEKVECAVVQLVVQKRRLFVKVCKLDSFSDVEIKNAKKGNREQNRKRDSMCEGYEDKVKAL